MSEPVPARVPRGSLIVPIEYAKKVRAWLRKQHAELRGRASKKEKAEAPMVMLHSGELIVPKQYVKEVKDYLKNQFGVKLPLKGKLKDEVTGGVQAAKGKTIQQVNISMEAPKPKRSRRAPAKKTDQKPEAPRPQPVSAPVVIAPKISFPAPAPVAAPVAPPVGAPSSISFPAPSGVLPGSLPSSFAAAIAAPPAEEEDDDIKEPVAASVGPVFTMPKLTEMDRYKIEAADLLHKLGKPLLQHPTKESIDSWINKLESIDNIDTNALAARLREKFPPKTPGQPRQKKGKLGSY
jgi:hypothetical protein